MNADSERRARLRPAAGGARLLTSRGGRPQGPETFIRTLPLFRQFDIQIPLSRCLLDEYD